MNIHLMATYIALVAIASFMIVAFVDTWQQTKKDK